MADQADRSHNRNAPGTDSDAVGITNRPLDDEQARQDVVYDFVTEMEDEGLRDDLHTDDRADRSGAQWRDERNMEPDTGDGDRKLAQGRPEDRP